jgi:hypothetical protein
VDLDLDRDEVIADLADDRVIPVGDGLQPPAPYSADLPEIEHNAPAQFPRHL